MKFRVGSNYVGTMSGNKETYTGQKIAVKKTEIEYWGNKILDASGFSMFFSPDRET